MITLAKLIERMLSQAVPSDIIADTVKLFERVTHRDGKRDASVTERDGVGGGASKTAERSKRYRDRKRDGKRDAERDASVTEGKKEFSPQTPLSEKNTPPEALRASPPKRGCRLPIDWTPDESVRAVGFTSGFDIDEQDAELEKMRDHFAAKPGQAGLKLDWNATARNWFRRAAELRRSIPRKQTRNGHERTEFQSALDEARKYARSGEPDFPVSESWHQGRG